MPTKITSPDDAALDELCAELAARADETDAQRRWPAEQLRLCGEYGVYEWFLPRAVGGQEWSDLSVVRGYLRLSAACLTTTFIITQRTGACRRIAASDNAIAQEELLPKLISGESFSTVGISHLTTSRQHLRTPALRAQEQDDYFLLDGYSPWVTGGVHADSIVLGATLDDGRQLLIAAPTDLPGLSAEEPPNLVAVAASDTGKVTCDGVRIPRKYLLAGPVENVMSSGSGAATGGAQTSTLAIGLARAAIDFLQTEAQKRNDLAQPAGKLADEVAALEVDLLAMADDNPVCSLQDLRTRANSVVLRAAQAALAAAKGAGFVVGHPTGRWCREALFFLVWSCPQPVMAANLCELAGLAE